MRRIPRRQHEHIPGTPAQEVARRRAYAAFCSMCDRKNYRKSTGRVWFALQLGIELRYVAIYEMDETECATVADICNAQKE